MVLLLLLPLSKSVEIMFDPPEDAGDSVTVNNVFPTPSVSIEAEIVARTAQAVQSVADGAKHSFKCTRLVNESHQQQHLLGRQNSE